MKNFMKKNLITLIVFFSIPIIMLKSPLLGNKNNIPKYFDQDFQKGIIEEVLFEELELDESVPERYNGKQIVKVKVASGNYKDQIYESTNLLTRSHNVLCEKNMKVVVGIRECDDGPQIWIYNYRRELTIYWLVGIFIGLLVLFGGMKGFRSALSLIFTGVIIIFILVPRLFSGSSAILATIELISITVVVSFVLISGWNRKTLVAILGTLGGIITAGIISYVAGSLTQLSGINMKQGDQLAYMVQGYGIDISGLMFSAILISSIGAVMDVAMSISSAIYEIKFLNKNLSKKDLFISGMNVGKDIMGTMSNTLILAFTGGSLTTIMLMYGYQLKYLQFINLQDIAIDMIQGFSGSIGIILTVPITALISVYLLDEKIEN